MTIASFSSRGTENNLFSGTALNLVSDDTTVHLRTAEDSFITTSTELMSLSGSIINGQPTGRQEEKTFNLTGKLGTNFDFTQVPHQGINQIYDLVFHFERIAD